MNAARNFNLAREKELSKLDLIERDAWMGWERSQQAALAEDGRERPNKTPVGDPRFLAQVFKCVALRRSMLALDLPVREPVPSRLIDCDDEQFAARMKEIELMFSEPGSDEESADEREPDGNDETNAVGDTETNFQNGAVDESATTSDGRTVPAKK